MKIWSTPHGDMGKDVNYNGLIGCYKTPLYAGTSEYPAVLVRCHTHFVGCGDGQ